jgi:hypothetical protein
MHQKISIVLQGLDLYQILLGGVAARPETARNCPGMRWRRPVDFLREGSFCS